MHIEATCLNTRVTGSGNLQKLGSGCGAHYGVLAFKTTSCVDLTVRTQSRKVHQVQARFGPSPNPEPDIGSSSAPMLNFELDQGPVHQGSGPDQSSEPNCGNTSLWTIGDVLQLLVYKVLHGQVLASVLAPGNGRCRRAWLSGWEWQVGFLIRTWLWHGDDW